MVGWHFGVQRRLVLCHEGFYRLSASLFLLLFPNLLLQFSSHEGHGLFFFGPSKRRGGGTAFFSLLFLCLDLILSLSGFDTTFRSTRPHIDLLSLSSVAGSRLSIFTWGGAKGYWGGARREGGR